MFVFRDDYLDEKTRLLKLDVDLFRASMLCMCVHRFYMIRGLYSIY